MTQPVIVTLDVEVAPLEVYCWGLWKQNIGLNQIVHEWSLLSFASKELGNNHVDYHDNRNAEHPRDDYGLMADLWKLLDDADIIVAQNGRKFDLKRINARFAMLGFPPPSPYRIIDTVVEARKHFGFTSNKLEWLSTHLTCAKKTAHKRFPGFELWSECLKGNLAAWNEMKKYNVADVNATEELYLKLRPWITGHPNMATYQDDEDEACPKCGSAEIVYRGKAYTGTGVFQRIRCTACGGWSRTRRSEKKRTQLTC